MPTLQRTAAESLPDPADTSGQIRSATSPDERLIIFARFPEPGLVKTRLIPALGAEGAARLHRALTRKTVGVAADFHSRRRASVEVWFGGGDELSVKQLLEPHAFCCLHQHGSDLGERLRHAIAAAFRTEIQRVVVIGTDCPDIEPETIAKAFDALRRFDVVVGPALDGGYYLIGLRVDRPELFRGIDWGSENVLKQTLARCRTIGCSTHPLDPLGDVDHAEDLLACRRLGAEFADVLPQTVPGRISIVIPTLNEESNLEQTLRPLTGVQGVEIIVADGGSSDRTVEVAGGCGATVVHANRGRGRQLNAGAALASGEVLLFLHADTRLPEGFQDHVWSILDRGAIAGAFPLHIDDAHAGLRWIEWGVNLRSRYLHMPYGDQGLFVRAELFYRLGGFPNWPLMEDYELCRRLRRHGTIRLASQRVSTSARRWLKLGLWRTTLINQLCIVAFRVGVSPDRLARWYSRCGEK